MPYFEEYLNQITRNVGNRTDSDTQQSIYFYFNEVQKWIGSVAPWRELERTLTFNLGAGVYQYAISQERWRKVYSLTLTDGTTNRGKVLEYISPQKWDTEVAPLLPQGRRRTPTTYTVWRHEVAVYPIPDKTYYFTMRCYMWPEEVTSPSSYVGYHELGAAVVALTTALVWMSLDEVSLANSWLQIGKGLLSTQGIDVTSIPAFGGRSQERTGLGTEYWTDPFVKEVK